jgi:aspartyl-tRNA(Asn)/glutamyl-tRNA(Gln) amidotransferase subunit A
MDIIDQSAFEIAKKIKQGDLSAVDVLNAVLDRIAAVDGKPGTLDYDEISKDDETKVHAFITLTADRARKQAELVDARVGAGEKLGPLAGVPVTIKDLFCLKGVRTTAGSRILSNFIAPYTATAIDRLENAGAVVLGKVNLDEFAFGSSNESSAFKPTPRNPWDLTRVPGGSSGGSAAAVASGQGFLSLGSDTGGSIRQPAAFCGVVGLKPTYGRVSRYGTIAFASSLDCPGPLARNVSDAALMLSVISGSDPRDSTAATLPVPNYLEGIDRGVKGMRIGLSPDYMLIAYPDPTTGEILREDLEKEIRDATLHAADVLAAEGAEIVENVPLPNSVFGIPAYFVLSRIEASSNLHRFDGVKYGYRSRDGFGDLHEMYRKTRAEGFGLEPKLRILMGMYLSGEQFSKPFFQHALKVRSMIRADFDSAFNPNGKYRIDALLTPTTPTPAFKIGDVYGDSMLMQYADQLTVPANHAGVPAISIPNGLTSQGLPMGLQLIAPDFAEASIFRVGYAFEQATANADWRRVRPHTLTEIGL